MHSDEKNTDQRRLRQERDRLNWQIARLVAESIRIETGADSFERDQYRDELERHRQEIRAYRADLQRFRDRYGPLGDD